VPEEDVTVSVARDTLVCVHAHPDDEALFTGGTQARFGAEGIRQVLVTCTDGSLGFDPKGLTPLDPLHDSAATASTRSFELRASAAVLGLDRVVELGYRDSGMSGWPTNGAPDAFINQPVEEVAERILEVLDEERPRIVATYDANGFYGHPDHIHTHHAVMAAVERCESVERVVAVAMTQAAVERAIEVAEATRSLLPEWLGSRLVGTVLEGAVDVEVDCSSFASLKQRAVAAHVSQIDNEALVAMRADIFAAVFGIERYVTVFDRSGRPSAARRLFDREWLSGS